MPTHVPTRFKLEDQRPTPMTVGLREAEAKRPHGRDAGETAQTHLPRRHGIPAVIGPKQQAYTADHHHFARALREDDAGPVGLNVLADLSDLPKGEFSCFLDNSHGCHASDASGTWCDLADDPYRSPVGALIRRGGCAKSDKPFSEFPWADHLRRRIDRTLVEQDFDATVEKAWVPARGREARCLPGWCATGGDGL